jgi:hypothetical protein
VVRAELAFLFIGGAGPLDRQRRPRHHVELPVASQARGGYAELGYDLLRVAHPGSSQELTLFGRFDYADTQADVPAGFVAREEFRRYAATLGLTYRPIPQIALKLDYRRHEFGAGDGWNEIASAITWMF